MLKTRSLNYFFCLFDYKFMWWLNEEYPSWLKIVVMGKLVKIYGRERTQGLYIKIYNMILIRKVRNPTLIRNLYSSLFLWQKPFTYSTSPIDMPIDKILKAVSRKKYNTAQDVMFCAMIFDLLTRNTSSPGIEHTDMTSEVHKMIFGSL